MSWGLCPALPLTVGSDPGGLCPEVLCPPVDEISQTNGLRPNCTAKTTCTFSLSSDDNVQILREATDDTINIIIWRG